ncbi:hypothetical protein CL1_0855 [Thermococcus cleftensis]|uniref:Sulfatase N-terminal domain-containing protein n=1 Tax=Thermococcus cleftensis (strain DSM 27260 / KACC 17922 / CL1) TaxID=163003 RepID=I3ZTM6_THECF|nr:hypothetical protein [Thermococcus cleftensis]AFL95060.1 hypothetical protein CL1_0855 [Thermococcus cleftensis]
MSTPRAKPNLLKHRIKEYTLKGLVQLLKRNPGVSVFSEDWDHLIILDDCRYDVFEEEFQRRGLPGKLESRPSLGSWTGEFLVMNFREERYDDIVFISANPFVDRYLKGKFHRLISVWKTHWNERYNTVPPGAVYRAALVAARRYPDKRLVVHFLQPHHPYFTLGFKDEGMAAIKRSVERGGSYLQDFPPEPIQEIYLSEIYAHFPVRRLIKAYVDNLQIVMPYVELLLHRLRGKSVVTSDHGELFGEKVLEFVPIKVYGHGIGRNPNLITVPWWIVRDEDRRNLRPLKEVKREIATIESRFGLGERTREETRLKLAISRLKLKKFLTMPPKSRT